MKKLNFNNAQIAAIDWAAQDRQGALRSMHRVKVGPVAAATSGWGDDVSGDDRRSVHAWLNGKGDARAAWWNLYSRAYIAFVPSSDLERAMYSFHRQHHAVTLAVTGFGMALEAMTRDILRRGVIAAVKKAVSTDGYSPFR